MIEIYHFIFSSFWVWAGTTILLAVSAHPIVSIVEAWANRKLP